MGTPEFSVPCLDILNKSKHQVVGVVTATDKPAGRGKKIKSSAIKKYSIDNELFLMQPEKLKADTFIDQLKELKADIFIVVAFRMLPKMVWDLPSLGTVNLHASLLPNYRVAAPINWAIINGEKISGITTFFINEEIDKGAILLQEEISIESSFSAGDLHDIMMYKGAKLILKTVDKLATNSLKKINQNSNQSELNIAPKLSKEICKINWNKDSLHVRNHIKGLSPYPGAWTTLSNNEHNKHFKIYNAEESNLILNKGELRIIDEKLYVGCEKGSIHLIEVQIEGKKRMSSSEFIKGYSSISNYYAS